MKKFFPLFAIAIFSFSFWACDDDSDIGEESPVYIMADWAKADSVLGGRHYFFKMDINSPKGTLEKLVISSRDGYNGETKLETIELSGTRKKMEYDFLLPVFPDSVLEVQLRATVTNSIGDEWTGTKYLKVFAADYTLTETSFNLRENPALGANNALYFSGGKATDINTGNDTDETHHHVVISYDKDAGTAASKAIRTFAPNVRMVRVNHFDYTNAKYNSVLNAFRDRYNVGDVKTFINNIAVGDIILVGTVDEAAKRATALGVIKVSGVPETNNPESDIYTFLVKGMGR